MQQTVLLASFCGNFLKVGLARSDNASSDSVYCFVSIDFIHCSIVLYLLASVCEQNCPSGTLNVYISGIMKIS